MKSCRIANLKKFIRPSDQLNFVGILFVRVELLRSEKHKYTVYPKISSKILKKKVSSWKTFVYGFSSNFIHGLAVKVKKVKQEVVYKFSKLINNDFFVL